MEQTVKSYLQLKKLEDPSFPYEEFYDKQAELDDFEPQIMFLGTISMKPTMYRAASAICLFMRGFAILMDCAEGSYGQLYDHF